MKKKYSIIVILVMAILLVLWTVWGNVTLGVTSYKVTSSEIPESFDN